MGNIYKKFIRIKPPYGPWIQRIYKILVYSCMLKYLIQAAGLPTSPPSRISKTQQRLRPRK